MSKLSDAALLAAEDKHSGPAIETCDYCKAQLLYPSKRHPANPAENRIVGRSERGGFICAACRKNRVESSWYDEVAKDFYARNKDGNWGALIRVAADLPGHWNAKDEGRARVSEFIGVLKEKIRSVTKPLPYDPDARERPVSRSASIRRAEAEANAI